jgi:hypothetical protein
MGESPFDDPPATSTDADTPVIEQNEPGTTRIPTESIQGSGNNRPPLHEPPRLIALPSTVIESPHDSDEDDLLASPNPSLHLDGFLTNSSEHTDRTSNAKKTDAQVFRISSATETSTSPNENGPKFRSLRYSTKQQTSLFRSKAVRNDQKIIGLGTYGLDPAVLDMRREAVATDDYSQQQSSQKSFKKKMDPNDRSVEQMEAEARAHATTNPWALLWYGNLSAFKVMGYYLITLETIVTCIITVGLTCYWYFTNQNNPNWNGGGLDFILLAFTVTLPLATALGMAFTRRERALIAIGEFRSVSQHILLAHSLWDWTENGGRAAAAKTVDWVEHVDAVMAQLVGIGDELSRFLTLPTTSRSRHRMTRQGRKEAKRTMEAAYYLIDSIETQRLTRLLLYSERLKKIGLPSGEISRIRQYERFISSCVEQLRLVKIYRTPQAMRSFARIFTVVLPPFYAPSFAQIARDTDKLWMGICFGIIACLCLTSLFESLQVLEDPFTAFLTLDGIDVREELEVLHFAQLVNTRHIAFPDAPPFPPGRRAALIAMTGNAGLKKLHHLVGLPPVQTHHGRHSRKPSEINLTAVFEPQDAHSGDLSEAEFVDHEDLELGTPLFPEVDDVGFNRDPVFSEDDATAHTMNRFSRHYRTGSNASDSMSRSGRGMTISQRLTRRALRQFKQTDSIISDSENV